MKKISYLFTFLLISSTVFGQIEIVPEKSTITPIKNQARIRSSENKPFWIGTGGSPTIHFDSSENHKIGIGVGHKSGGAAFSPTIFTEHAKVHIRHEGGPGSEFQNQKGPHLLLDEATAINPAVIRFRQSTLETSPTSAGAETMTPGARYWDIRGFANGSNPGNDEFRILNSGAAEDLLKISGYGDFTFSASNPLLELKGSSTSLYPHLSLEFGVSGQSNTGKIRYTTDGEVFEFYSGNVKTMTLDNGYVGIGSDVEAPKIKTFFRTINMAIAGGVTTNMTGLPATEGKILSVDIMITNTNGIVVGADSKIDDSEFLWSINGTTLSLITTALNSSLIFGRTARVFITYQN